MTTRTRYFLFGSVTVVLVGLCTGLVAYYNGGLPVSASSEAKAELAYLPSNATAVAYANVTEVMKSDFRKRVQQALPTGEEKQRLQDETGIDLEHDIDSVVAGFIAGDTQEKGAVVLIHGHFDAAKIEALATAHGAQAEDYKGKHLLSGFSGFALAHNSGGLAFLEPNVLALGDTASIKRAVDAQASGDNITRNDGMMAMVNDLKNGNNAWVVGRFDAVSQSVSLPDIAKEKLATIQYFAVSAKVDNGVTGIVRAEARDDKSADDLRAVVNGALAAARLVTSEKNQNLETIVNSLQMSGRGKTIAVSFRVTPEMLDMLNGVAGLSKLGRSPAAVIKH